MAKTRTVLVELAEVAKRCGCVPGPDGRLNLPPVQDLVDRMAWTSAAILGPWEPGDALTDVTVTGAGPVWAYLAMGHGLHGRARRLTYASPNTPPLVIWSHGWSADE